MKQALSSRAAHELRQMYRKIQHLQAGLDSGNGPGPAAGRRWSAVLLTVLQPDSGLYPSGNIIAGSDQLTGVTEDLTDWVDHTIVVAGAGTSGKPLRTTIEDVDGTTVTLGDVAGSTPSLGGTTGDIDSGSTTLTADDLEPGQVIVIEGAGAGGADLQTTVVSVDGDQVTVADAAGTDVSGATITILQAVPVHIVSDADVVLMRPTNYGRLVAMRHADGSPMLVKAVNRYREIGPLDPYVFVTVEQLDGEWRFYTADCDASDWDFGGYWDDGGTWDDAKLWNNLEVIP